MQVYTLLRRNANNATCFLWKIKFLIVVLTRKSLPSKYIFHLKSSFRDHETISDMRESRNYLPISKREVVLGRGKYTEQRNACR